MVYKQPKPLCRDSADSIATPPTTHFKSRAYQLSRGNQLYCLWHTIFIFFFCFAGFIVWLLAFHLQTQKTRNTNCFLAYSYDATGILVSEEVSHFIYWHNGRSCPVSTGGFDRRSVWPCIVQGNCKWMHEIEKNNGQSGSCLLQF